MTHSPQQQIFDFSFRQTAMGQEDFIVSSCNQEAVLWLDKWEQWNAPFLIVVGEEKSGKSHLCHVWQQMVGASHIDLKQVLYDTDFFSCLDGAGFYYIDESGLGSDAMMSQPVQQFLFHLYNLLRECGGKCVITANIPPTEWSWQLKDAQSRVLSCPSTTILSPDDALLETLLMQRFKNKQILVKYEVVSYVINRIERSFKALDEVVARLDAISLERKRPLTLPLVREVMEDE